MQVLNSNDQLENVELRLNFCKSFATSHQLAQSLILAQLKQNKNVLFILKKLGELHNVVVPQAFVNLDFRVQLRGDYTVKQLTFCLAFDLISEALGTILTAYVLPTMSTWS